MATIDWVIVGSYILIATLIGVYFTKKAAKSTSDYFVAGRNLPWFIAGTSIAACTFAADTPLFVAAMSRDTGISSNWFWWSFAIGQVATVFFFARLWRRTGVLTDIEFIVKRYEPSPARAILRAFKVLFDGILVNGVGMAIVTLAMAKILKVMLHLSEAPLFHIPFFGDLTPSVAVLLILGISVAIYTTLAGQYGIAYLDFAQFGLAMGGSILLAVIAYVDASSGEGLMAKLSASPEFKPAMLNFFPDIRTFSLPTFTFFVYIGMVWWAEAPGRGYAVQKLLAARSEKDSFLAFLWYNILHYIVRPWPWIVVGMLSLYYLPNLEDSELAFPGMVDAFMPIGLKGLMVASLMAAFTSTIGSQLNWGTSYIINDLYRPFIRPDKSQKHYVTVSRIWMVVLVFIGVIIATKLPSILEGTKYIMVVWGGVGTVMIARWYWWRINSYSEISAIITSLIVGNFVQITMPSTPDKDLFSVRLIVTTAAVTVVWVIVTLLTSKKPGQNTIAFYSKMRIGGLGWKKVRQISGVEAKTGEFRDNFIAWLSCLIFLYSLLLGTGKFVFHEWGHGLIYMVIMIASGFVLKKYIGRMRFQ